MTPWMDKLHKSSCINNFYIQNHSSTKVFLYFFVKSLKSSTSIGSKQMALQVSKVVRIEEYLVDSQILLDLYGLSVFGIKLNIKSNNAYILYLGRTYKDHFLYFIKNMLKNQRTNSNALELA